MKDTPALAQHLANPASYVLFPPTAGDARAAPTVGATSTPVAPASEPASPLPDFVFSHSRDAGRDGDVSAAAPGRGEDDEDDDDDDDDGPGADEEEGPLSSPAATPVPATTTPTLAAPVGAAAQVSGRPAPVAVPRSPPTAPGSSSSSGCSGGGGGVGGGIRGDGARNDLGSIGVVRVAPLPSLPAEQARMPAMRTAASPTTTPSSMASASVRERRSSGTSSGSSVGGAGAGGGGGGAPARGSGRGGGGGGRASPRPGDSPAATGESFKKRVEGLAKELGIPDEAEIARQRRAAGLGASPLQSKVRAARMDTPALSPARPPRIAAPPTVVEATPGLAPLSQSGVGVGVGASAGPGSGTTDGAGAGGVGLGAAPRPPPLPLTPVPTPMSTPTLPGPEGFEIVFGRDGPVLKPTLPFKRRVKLFSDIDDTLFANYHDRSLPHGLVYPGVLALYHALLTANGPEPAGSPRGSQLVFVTAR
jgi:hypothetical protein